MRRRGPAYPVGVGTYPIPNYLQNIIEILFDILVGKPEKSNTEALQPVLSHPILHICSLGVVTLTVNFNGQHQVFTIEINDVGIDGSLTVKVVVKHLLLLQPIPEKHFCKCTTASELSREILEPRIIPEDFSSQWCGPTPASPPRRGLYWSYIYQFSVVRMGSFPPTNDHWNV